MGERLEDGYTFVIDLRYWEGTLGKYFCCLDICIGLRYWKIFGKYRYLDVSSYVLI